MTKRYLENKLEIQAVVLAKKLLKIRDKARKTGFNYLANTIDESVDKILNRFN